MAATTAVSPGDDVPVHRREPRQQLVLNGEWNREFVHAGLQQLDLAEAVGLRDVQVCMRRFHRVAVIDARACEYLAELVGQLRLEPGQFRLLEVVADARVLARTPVPLVVTYKGDQAYFSGTIEGFFFNGGCGINTCDMSIAPPNSSLVSTMNGGFSKLNDNSISMSIFGDQLIAEVECRKI